MSDLAAEKLYDAGVAAASAGDFKSAVELWREAAKIGHAKAEYNLGVAYARGKGVRVDRSYALRLWANAEGHEEAAKHLAAFSPSDPPPRTSGRAVLSKLWSAYIRIGSIFALVKFGSLAAWMLLGPSGRPDLPWYWRIVQDGGTAFFALLGVVATPFLWPYGIYILLKDGKNEFIRSMFYLWY